MLSRTNREIIIGKQEEYDKFIVNMKGLACYSFIREKRESLNTLNEKSN